MYNPSPNPNPNPYPYPEPIVFLSNFNAPAVPGIAELFSNDKYDDNLTVLSLLVK